MLLYSKFYSTYIYYRDNNLTESSASALAKTLSNFL